MCLTTEDHTHHFNNNFQFSEGWPFPNSPKGGHDCLKLSSLLHTSVVYTDIAIHTHQATHCMLELIKLTAHAGLVFCECDWPLMLLFWDIPSIFLVLLTSKYSIACDRNNKFMTDFPFRNLQDLSLWPLKRYLHKGGHIRVHPATNNALWSTGCPKDRQSSKKPYVRPSLIQCHLLRITSPTAIADILGSCAFITVTQSMFTHSISWLVNKKTKALLVVNLAPWSCVDHCNLSLWQQ